jgi:hypothetical protein
MTSAVTSVGSLLSITSSLSSVVGIAASFLVFHLGAQYIKTDGLTPVFYAYSGDLIALVLSQLAAAYAAVKTIDASVHTNTGFFYLMRGGSSAGDFMGLYELLATLAFLTWSLVISVVGYVEAAMLWQKYEDMEKNGVAMTQMHGYKFLTLGFIIGIGAWISGLALGDSCAELLGFFDNYNTKTEGTDDGLTSGTRDPDGTSIVYDLTYHVITTMYTYFVVSAIAVGAYIFGFIFLGEEEMPSQ